MQKAFFIGIKGVGMTSLALSMQDAGWSVSGSDTDESFITDEILNKRGIKIQSLSDPIPNVDKIIYSAAYPAPITPEVFVPISLAQALAEFVVDKHVIAVAGVGGKTTTTAMLATMFHQAGRDVGYYVGTGSISGLDAPGHCGTDPYFVVEADEYAISKTDTRPKFSLITPRVLITTNIIHDHPDIYPDQDSTLVAFSSLITRIPESGTWIFNDSDPLSLKLYKGLTLVCKTLAYNGDLPRLDLSVFGDQNQLDAQASVLAAQATGMSHELALTSIKAYTGAGRRQEFHGEIDGRLLYDDYGHHPREIELTLNSFKKHFPGQRVLLIFESHTYSRTEALLEDFAKAIAIADFPFIMPIFESAREKGVPHKITPESFIQAVAKYNSQAKSLTWDNAGQTVWESSLPGDIILTMGAGFVYKLHDLFKLK